MRLLKMAVLPITFCSSSSFSSALLIPSIFSKSQFIAALMNIAELLYECIVVLRGSRMPHRHSRQADWHQNIASLNSSSVHFGRYKIAVCFFEH